MKKTKTDLIELVPEAQVIITGKPVTPEQAIKIIEYIKNFCISTWCHQNGEIGFLDAVKVNTTFSLMCQEFHDIAQKFLFLELGITIMNGSPGTYNQPIASYKLIDGKVKRDMTMSSHLGHPAPKRAQSQPT